jgi:hypothetical protein
MAAADRTEAKLRFAALSLHELNGDEGLHGDDFQRSHEENFLFHLYGVIDAFLHEINEHHRCGLAANKVTIERLEKALAPKKRTSAQLDEIKSLGGDVANVVARIEEWRHSSMHRGGPQRLFFVGGEEHGRRRFTVPGTTTPASKHIPDEFADALDEVRSLIKRLRADLIASPP